MVSCQVASACSAASACLTWQSVLRPMLRTASTLASLARGNMVFLQAIVPKPWRYVCNKALSGCTYRLQLFQGRVLILQQTNLRVVRTHTLAEQANRLQG